MTSDEKLEYVRGQIQDAETGLTKLIRCPYCQSTLDFSPPTLAVNIEGLSEFEQKDWQPPTCCESFALAVIAILQRQEQRDAKDLADRIKRNAGGAAVFN